MSDKSLLGQVSETGSVVGPSALGSKRWVASLGTILLLSGLIIGVQRLLVIKSGDSSRVDRILPVKTIQIKAVNSYAVARTYTGQVTSARASELGFERAGKIVWLNVTRGDEVATGTPLAKLDTQNLEAQRQQLLAEKDQAVAVLQELQNGPRSEVISAARAAVGDLQYQLELEKLKRFRREHLYKQGAISKEQLDEVAFNQNALSDRLAAARSKLDELAAGTRLEQIAAQQAEVKQLAASITDIEITIAKSTITAPFSGTIARRLDEGTVVSAGQPALRLVERANPEVEIGVPVDEAARLEPGSQQRVQIGQKIYRATLASSIPEVNPATRTRTVILKLDSPALRSVAPQQIARLVVMQTVATTGYWLPTTALVRGERGLWSCYALVGTEKNKDKPDSVERRDVEVLYTEGDRVLVRGTLQSNDPVIASGTQRIVPGQLVQAIN